MTERLDIANQILTDLKDKIKVSRGYKTQPAKVVRGFYKWTDFILKPAIGFSMAGDIPDTESESGVVIRWFRVFFYGYASTDGAGKTDAIYDLLQDVEDFLMSADFTYYGNTEIGDIDIREGGVSDEINFFLMETRIAYCVE
jgi:hypothetical protein